MSMPPKPARCCCAASGCRRRPANLLPRCRRRRWRWHRLSGRARCLGHDSVVASEAGCRPWRRPSGAGPAPHRVRLHAGVHVAQQDLAVRATVVVIGIRVRIGLAVDQEILGRVVAHVEVAGLAAVVQRRVDLAEHQHRFVVEGCGCSWHRPDRPGGRTISAPYRPIAT